MLEDNNGDDLTVMQNGMFAFATPVPSGGMYAVTVKTQPSAPSQTCVVGSGSGAVGSATVTNVTVTCTTNSYTVGGTVSGLAANESVVLQDNGGDDLTVKANGAFQFPTAVLSGHAYLATVLTNPASPIAQTCTVTNGTGTVGGANVTNVQVTCTTNTCCNVGGMVSGLVGSGLVLSNGTDMLPITQNGAFQFPTKVASGATYGAAKVSDPNLPWQTCLVTNGSGSVTDSDITSITVTCTTNTYTVGGSVSGLGSGDSLQLLNGADSVSVGANGAFTFPTSVASGQTYNVTVGGESGSIAQSCTVSSGSGTVGGGNVTTVTVNCATNTYTIGGNVSGLTGSGVTLTNGGDKITVTGSGSFSFPTSVASGNTYSVADTLDPTNPWQTCTVTNGSGTVGGANVINVQVSCTTNTYSISVAVSGLASGESISLTNNSANAISASASGTYTFSNVASGTSYSIAATSPTSPISQSCVVAGGGGMVTNANITNVTVKYTTNTFSIGNNVSGLTGSGLVPLARQRRRQQVDQRERQLQLPDRDCERIDLQRDHLHATVRADMHRL